MQDRQDMTAKQLWALVRDVQRYVMRQRGKKYEFAPFFFRARGFRSRSSFFRAPTLLLNFAFVSAKARKKCGRPPLVKEAVEQWYIEEESPWELRNDEEECSWNRRNCEAEGNWNRRKG
jgi:hypothetical protein